MFEITSRILYAVSSQPWLKFAGICCKMLEYAGICWKKQEWAGIDWNMLE